MQGYRDQAPQAFSTQPTASNSFVSWTHSHNEPTLFFMIRRKMENCQLLQRVLDLKQHFGYALSFLNFVTFGKYLNFSKPLVTSVTLEIEYLFHFPDKTADKNHRTAHLRKDREEHIQTRETHTRCN